jgi:hypothetical protein
MQVVALLGQLVLVAGALPGRDAAAARRRQLGGASAPEDVPFVVGR